MAPLAWIRRIASELPELKTIPLFGNSPPFDWDHFSSTIASRFGLPNIAIRPQDRSWKNLSEIRDGKARHILPIGILPLGTIYWAISKEDLSKLTSRMMKPEDRPLPLSEIFQEGFFRFAVLEALDSMQQMPPFTNLTLQTIEEESLSFEKAFCIDIEIDFDSMSCYGELIIPDTFRSSWLQHFSHLEKGYFPAEIARQTMLNIGVKTGSISLRQDEWEKVEPGDFIFLDRGSYDAHKGTGLCLLMLQSIPIFNARIKQNKIELIDYAFYYEENMTQKGENPAENIAALKDLPLNVTVEIARLKITLDQLMHLTPGNLLELPIHPDQGVSLTVDGQIIGRAELVYLGEQLGIRILET